MPSIASAYTVVPARTPTTKSARVRASEQVQLKGLHAIERGLLGSPHRAIGSQYGPSVPLKGALLNGLIVGHSPRVLIA